MVSPGRLLLPGLLLFAVIPGQAQCPPRSTLPCDQVKVELPFALDFTGTEGGLSDGSGRAGMGFRMADRPSARLATAVDPTTTLDPTFPQAPGYEPSRLTVQGGRLAIATTKGIAFLKNGPGAGTTTNTNSQLNALGVGIVPAGKRISIQTTLVNPQTGTSSQQAGIWFGLDEDNFVKLVVTNNANNPVVELRKEVNATSVDATDRVQSGSIPGIATKTIRLKLEVDNVVTGGNVAIRAYYSVINTATGVTEVPYQAIGTGPMPIPASFVTGVPLSTETTENVTFAGIFASHRTATTPLTYQFEDFKVEAIEYLTLSPSVLNFVVHPSGSATRVVTLAASAGSPEVQWNSPAPWLNLTGVGTGTGQVPLMIQGSTLTPGVYNTTLTASATGYASASTALNVYVTNPLPTAATELKVNFQDQNTPAPTGYVRDFGQPFGARLSTGQGTGLTYGWKRRSGSDADAPLDLTPNGRNRNVTGLDVTLATFMHMQGQHPGNFAGTAVEGYWEALVPNGQYDVTVSVGDATAGANAADKEFHTLRVEGSTVINRFESAGANGSLTRFTSGKARVTVNDGALTIDADGGYNTKINSVIITPVAANIAPVLSWATEPPAHISEGVAFSLDAGATDPDQGQTLTFSLEAAPAGASIDAQTGLLTWTPTEAQGDNATTYTFVVKVTDNGDTPGADTKSFVLTVREVNAPPRLATSLSDQTVAAGTAFSYHVAGSFADDDVPQNALTYAILPVGASPLPAWLTIEPTTGVLGGTPGPADAGTVAVQVSATDGTVSATADFNIVVTTKQPPVVVLPPMPGTHPEGELFTFTVSADREGVTYSLENPPAGATITANGTFAWTPSEAQGDNSIHNLVVKATDSDGLSSQAVVAVQITEVNQKPETGSGLVNQQATAGEPFLYPFAAAAFADPDLPANTLSYTAALADNLPLPGWLQFNASTRTFLGTPTGAETLVVYVTANDGSPEGNATASFTLTVAPAAPVNTAPIVQHPVADQTATAGAAFSFALPANTFADNDAGDVLSYNVSALPNGLTFDAASRTFAGTPTRVETVAVTVTATDLAGATTSDVFTIAVVACPPVSTLACDQLVVPLTAAFVLDFTGSEGGLTDQNGLGTGFRMADVPSARLAVDGPAFNTLVPGYEPSRLEIAGGQLRITTHRGIAFARPATNPRTNSQLNALGVGIVAATQKVAIETTLSNPFVGTESQQAGIWYGLDEDNYVKLVVNNGLVELRREIGGVSGETATDVIKSGTTAIPGIATSTVKLRLVLDHATNTVTGFYTLNGGAEVALGTADARTLSIATLIAGKTIGTSSNVSFAGIFATHRNAGNETATTPLANPPVYAFDSFRIEALTPTLNTLAFTPASLNYSVVQGNPVSPQTATLTATGSPVVTLSKSASSDWLVLPAAGTGSLSFGVDATGLPVGTYTATVTASAEGYAPVELAVNLTVNANTPVSQAIKINFQDAATVPPSGWLKDYGMPFGTRTATEQGTANGAPTYTYGWKKRADGLPLNLSVGGTANLGNGRNRLTAANYANASETLKRQVTFMHMQGDDPTNFNGTREEGYWEIVVPNGVYDVSLSVGDYNAGQDPESHTVNVEGVNAINAFVPSGATGAAATRLRVTTSPVRVTVTDGALTVNASEIIGGVTYNGVNTKINSVLIEPVSANPYLYWSASAQGLVIEAQTTDTKTFSLELSKSNTQQDVVYNLSAAYGSGAGNWLSFSATHNGSEPNVTFDYSGAKGFPVGTYSAVITAAAEGFTSASFSVQVTVVAAGSSQPYVIASTPANGATGVALNPTIAANSLYVPDIPGIKGGVDNTTVVSSTVKLLRLVNGATTEVLGTVQGTGGGDAISFSPTFALEPNTTYKFVITDGVKSYAGTSFRPYEATFTTGAAPTDPNGPLAVEFKPEPIPGTQGKKYTSVTFGPDGRFYAMRLDGTIERYNRDLATGKLSGMQEIKTLVNKYGPRSAVGLTFDPAATADNLILWTSHCTAGLTNAPEFDGKLSRLSGANLETEQLYLTNLPRSKKDHLVNSIVFGPDGAMYFCQGSNSSMGTYDGSWQREETLLAGAVLRFDLTKLQGITLPLDVKTTANQAVINAAPANSITMADGLYNPYATNSPLTIYASGVRNAYDLVFHSNGQLYVPTNGSAAGGNSPASVLGTRRPNGTFYNGPQIPATTSIEVQHDWLFRVSPLRPLGYYGHPNPLRGEYVANRGYADNKKYPATVVPDVNYRGAAHDFEYNKSPNGAIEYKSNAFGGALKGWLLVCRFSGGSDIIALKPGSIAAIPGMTPESDDKVFDITDVKTGSGANGIPGFGGLTNPLDITEDPATGNLYVIEYNWNNVGGKPTQLTLLKATAPSAPAPVATVAPAQLIDNEVAGGAAGANRTVTIANTGNAPLSVTAVALEGANNGEFILSGLPGTFPITLAPNVSTQFNVAFNPGSAGVKTATIKVSSTGNPDKVVALSGLGTIGLGGSNEPSLQRILDTYGIPVNVGDDNAANNLIHSANARAALLGEEISAQQFERAVDGPVTVEPLAVFGPQDASGIVATFGWYTSGNANAKNQLFSVPNSGYQTLNVPASGVLSFDPATASFGFYSKWPYFEGRELFSEDALNTFTGAIPHHVRVYPLKNAGGATVENAYIVATEEHTSGFDFQDVVVIVRNVRPVGQAIAKKLEFSVPKLDFVVTPGVPAEAQSAALSATTGTPAVILTKSANSEWLVLPQTATLGNLQFTISDAGLAPGTYTATVTASANGYESSTLQVNLTVNQPVPMALLKVEAQEIILDGGRFNGANYGNLSKVFEVENTGTLPLTLSEITITGTHAANFSYGFVSEGGEVNNTVIEPGDSRQIRVAFNASAAGAFDAQLNIASNAGNAPATVIGLHGLWLNGKEGGAEPWLSNVVKTLGYGINVGWESLTSNTNASPLMGEEVLVQLFEKASTGVVSIKPVGRYSPKELLPFGYYTRNGTTPVLAEVGALTDEGDQHQALFPQIASGTDQFDPQGAVFGVYVSSKTFGRNNYTEDGLNTGIAHRVRTYPMKDRAGQPIPNSYLVCFEDASNGDYQDYMFVLSNVIPAGSRKTLAFSQSDVRFDVPQGGTAPAKSVTLGANTASPAVTLTKSAGSDWLILPANPVLGALSFGVNAGNLLPGIYSATVTASAAGYESAALTVNLAVNGPSANAVRINFQLATSATPADYLPDAGLAYNDARGYGWVNPTTKLPKDHALSMRERAGTIEFRLRTLALLQNNTGGQTPGSWEYKVPAPGLYNVTVSAGDPDFFDSQHQLNVEGTTAVSFTPTATDRFRSATVTVEVLDGKLTIDANGGTNSKINYIIIDAATPEGDLVAPVASVSLSGTLQTAGVYRNQVVATVTATDAGGSGLESVQYSLNDGAYTAYFGPILLSTAGTYSLRVKATDGNGNQTITEPTSFSVLVPVPSNAKLLVENLDKFPKVDELTFSLIREPWRRQNTDGTFTPYNANHDSVTVRLHNKGMAALRVDNLVFSRPNSYRIVEMKPQGGAAVAYNPATALPFTINSNSFVDFTVTFVNDVALTVNRVRVLHDKLTVVSNDDEYPSRDILLHALLQNRGEGSNEPTAAEMIDAFGFKSNPVFTKTAPNQGKTVVANSDEVYTPYFVTADPTREVYVRYLGAYHGCCSSGESLKWFLKGNNRGGSNPNVVQHIGLDGQTLLPRRGLPNQPGESANFRPAGPFSFHVGGNFLDKSLHNFASQPADNSAMGIKVWKARDVNGNIVPNAYFMANDYLGQPDVTNYDYQDNMYFISNVKPETGSAYYSELAAVPAAADFGSAVLGTAKTLTVEVKNLGQVYPAPPSDPDLQITAVEVVGANLNEFAVTLPAVTKLAPQATGTITVRFNPLTKGIKNAVLLVRYMGGPSPLRIPLYGIADDNCSSLAAVKRIKGAADAAVTIAGKAWEADNAYRKGSIQLDRPALAPIAATDNDALYQTYLSASTNLAETRYEIPVANGNYSVRMHFVEHAFNAPGLRVFSIRLENQLRLANLDIFGEVGAKAALVKDFEVTVTDGRLDVQFNPSVNRVAIAGLEILRAGASTTGIALAAASTTGAECGKTDGSVTLTVTNSTAASFSYKLGPNGVYQASPTFTGLAAGAQTFFVKENTPGGCETSAVITVPNRNNTLAFTVSAAPVACNALTGTATVSNITGGSGNYTVTWGSNPVQTSFTAALRPGRYTVTVTDNTGGCSKTQEVEVSHSSDCQVTAIRINAGGAAYTAKNGNVFAADQYFGTSSVYSNLSNGIENTEDDLLYQSERSSSTDKGSFTYSIPVKNGNHTVILHFAEIYAGTVGRRVMNVTLEGTTVLSNYDIVADAGFRTPVTKAYGVAVNDGVLTMVFSATADRPKVSAIEVISSFDKANAAPVADAGGNKTITLPTNSVTLTGTGSDPEDGSNVTYAWTQVNGPAAALVSPNAATTQATGLVAGTYTFRLTVTDSKGAMATSNAVVTVNPAASSLVRINAGGNAQTVNGTVWMGCLTGNCGNYVTGGGPYTQTTLSGPMTGIPGNMNQAIFQTEWTGGQSGNVPVGQTAFAYSIPLQNGKYTVRLHFMELNKFGPGLRVFDVNLEGGTKELVNFDIYKEAGNAALKAIVREFTANVQDGVLTIEFIRQVENAKISAIEVLPFVNAQPVVAVPVPDQTAAVGAPFNYTFPASTFTDANAGTTLTYTAALADGSDLPLWLTFNGNTRTFSGTPSGSDPASVAIRVTANDGDGGSVSDAFFLTVQAAKVTPVITWDAPAPIGYGTALSDVQLNATAAHGGSTVSGTFTYQPAKGTVPNAGTQTLTVTFVPANTALYNAPAPVSVSIAVAKGDQVVTFPAVADKLTTDAPFNLGASTNASGLAVTYTLVSGPATVSASGLVTLTGAAGTVVVEATQAGNANYNAAQAVRQSFAVTGPVVVPTGPEVRINAGGTAQTVNGTTWQGCVTGDCGNYVTGGFAYTQVPARTISGVPAAMNQALFQTEWTGGQTNGVPVGAVAFKYNVPVANGNYLVRLYFAELNKNGANLRKFDVNIEGGAKELTNFDIFVAAGGTNKAIVREFPVSIADGNVTIDFIRQVENAKVSAIEILPATVGRLATQAAGTQYPSNPLLVVNVFPNPTSDKFSVELPGMQAAEVTTLVTAADGNVVLRNKHLVTGENTLEIDIAHLQSGVYLLEIRSCGKHRTVRVMKY